jgi:hypothetical protein
MEWIQTESLLSENGTGISAVLKKFSKFQTCGFDMLTETSLYFLIQQ